MNEVVYQRFEVTETVTPGLLYLTLTDSFCPPSPLQCICSQRTCSLWSRATRGKAWSSMCTTLTPITAERWSSHRTVPGEERAGNTKTPFMFRLFMTLLCLVSQFSWMKQSLCSVVWTQDKCWNVILHFAFLRLPALDVGLATDTCTGFPPGLLRRGKRSASQETLLVIPSVLWRMDSLRSGHTHTRTHYISVTLKQQVLWSH